MKLKEFLKNLEAFVDMQPEILDYEVLSAVDDEGNGYNTIYYTPTLGEWDGEEFADEEGLVEMGDEFELNSICIN